MFRQHINKHPVLVALTVIAAATPMMVHAGLLDSLLGKDSAEMPEMARYDREPALVFGAGPLETDILGNWNVGGCSLRFTEESLVRIGQKEADARDLHMGQEARVMGYRLADGTVAVRRLSVTTMRQQASKLGVLERVELPVGEMPENSPN